MEIIAGVDEAGRGPLAGPVVAAAVILSNDKIKEEYERLTVSLEEQSKLMDDIVFIMDDLEDKIEPLSNVLLEEGILTIKAEEELIEEQPEVEEVTDDTGRKEPEAEGNTE